MPPKQRAGASKKKGNSYVGNPYNVDTLRMSDRDINPAILSLTSSFAYILVISPDLVKFDLWPLSWKKETSMAKANGATVFNQILVFGWTAKGWELVPASQSHTQVEHLHYGAYFMHQPEDMDEGEALFCFFQYYEHGGNSYELFRSFHAVKSPRFMALSAKDKKT